MSNRIGTNDERDLIRFVEAVALGEMADRRFAEACRKRGLRPRDCIDDPLYWLSLPPPAAASTEVH
jgi:hypothetical protein